MEQTGLIDRKALPQGKISFEEFLAWADEDTHAEWEDRGVVMASPASRRHQDLSTWLTMVLGFYIRHHKLGWMSHAPFLIRLQKSQQGREPDFIFLKNENRARLQETHLDGPADLVVEIASPESVGRDRGRKFLEYETEGIPEYWLIDPVRRQVEFYRLGDDQHYHLTLPDADDLYYSLSVTGFWLKVDWLWQDPLPDELDILRQLGVLAG